MLGIDAYMPGTDWTNKLRDIGVLISTTGNWLWYKMQLEPKGDIVVPIQNANAIENLYSSNIHPCIQVFGTPDFARNNVPDEQFSVVTEPLLFRNFMKKLINLYPTVKYWQLYNEIDADKGAKDYFGGWGVNHIQRYIDLIGSVSDLRGSKRRFSVGLMFNDDTRIWSEKFVSRMGHKLLNSVNLHYYAHWMTGWGYKELQVYLKDLQDTITLAKDIYGDTNLWISETNAILIRGSSATPEFEEYKAKWFEEAIPIMFDMGIKKVLGYSLRSGWNGADIIGTPSEQIFKKLCERYNR